MNVPATRRHGCLEICSHLSVVFLLIFWLFLLFEYQGAAAPTVGAHTFTNYDLGQNSKVTISTPAMNTQTSGSTMLVCIGRGDISAFTQVPADNRGNTPYSQL